jgi:hypothetical protein
MFGSNLGKGTEYPKPSPGDPQTYQTNFGITGHDNFPVNPSNSPFERFRRFLPDRFKNLITFYKQG